MNMIDMNNEADISVEETETLVESTVQLLRDKIVSGEFAARALLNERRLSEQLGLSRTPIRAALRQLEGEGYLGRDGRSVFVRAITFEEVMEILAVRLVLEAESVRAAVGRMAPQRIAEIRKAVRSMTDSGSIVPSKHWEVDDMLHLSIAQASRNSLLYRLIFSLRLRTRMFGLKKIPKRFEPGKAEHLALLDAIEAGDTEAAVAAMRLHLQNTRDSILAEVKGVGL
jgi:DNA-binding GntR family transcriptional regulator